MIHIPQNQNEVLHNRLRGGSDKEVPANSWGFQTRMGLGQNFQTCSDLCSEILELQPLLMRRKLPWHLFRTRGLPEMRIVPIWQILLLCKSFRILHSQDFKGMASLKEILHHSEIPSISNEQIDVRFGRQNLVNFTHSYSLTHHITDENVNFDYIRTDMYSNQESLLWFVLIFGSYSWSCCGGVVW